MTERRSESTPPELKAYFQGLSEMGRLEIERRKAEGEAMHQAPLGFKKVHQDGRSVLVRDPATWYLVEQAHILRDKGYTLEDICWSMERSGLRSKRGNVITIGAMARILKRDRPSSVTGTDPSSAA